MNPTTKPIFACLLVLVLLLASACGDAPTAAGRAADAGGALLRATYSPLHFKPAIGSAGDEECLACHREVLEDRPRAVSPAGVEAAGSLAGYQRTSTYRGGQDSFHRRHLVTPLAKSLMKLKCNTCHQGHDPREEAPGSSATAARQDDAGFTLRKQVDVGSTCLKCHGRMPASRIMGLPGAWPEVGERFQNDCLTCHATVRTRRHRVDYLDARAIEDAAVAARATKGGGDVCYGCHGGRAWYRTAYPYARNPWPGMPEGTPEWAQQRPKHSEARFLKP